ncbi:MAG: RNA methyltransferase [Bacteroidales bacterium]|jgi:tRNA G18 (ribose-2'-O)-methylase SpoU|nr:RNA methyltransferase [Bacteroidales bacterium]
MQQQTLDALGRINVEDYRKAKKIPVTVILNDIRSMNNVGSIFRSCDAFRIERLILCGITPKPPHRDINKTALGATESVDWEYKSDILPVISDYRSKNYKIYALEQTDQSIFLNELQLDINEKAVLILGNEVEGVSQSVLDNSDYALEIEQAGTKHSLNVAVASGIAFYVFYNQMKHSL